MALTPGKGTVLQLSISAVFTTIAQGVKIALPKSSNPEIDSTILTDVVRTFIASIVDSGEASFSGWFDPAATTHQKVKTDHDAGTSGSWKIVLTDAGAAEIAFSGIITKWEPGEAVVDGLVALDFTIKVSGAITVTP